MPHIRAGDGGKADARALNLDVEGIQDLHRDQM
jgi:hypothetical protein